MNPRALSPRQRRILEFVNAYRIEHDYSPSVRDVRSGIGIGSMKDTHEDMQALKEYGYLDWEEGKGRTLRVLIPVT